jgi:uncharacterized protein (DUF305 family)
MIIRDRSSNEEIRQLALDTILTQQAQIGQMQGWLAGWNQPLSGEQVPMGRHRAMMGMASQQDINRLRSFPVQEAETTFLKLMIRHHQGGVIMAQQALNQTQRPEVQRLATAIVNSQQSEIQAMQALLARQK